MPALLAVSAAVWLGLPHAGRGPHASPALTDRPWHLALVVYRLPAAVPFDTLEVDLDLLQDVPGDQPFFVMALSGRINDVRCYTGVTSCGVPVSLPGAPVSWLPGAGYNFTRWQTRDPAYIRREPDGFQSAAGHEGDHVGVRKHGSVKKGRYTLTLRVKDRVPGPTPHFWIEESVRSHSTGKSDVIGSLRFDGEEAVLNPVTSSFFEVHGDTPKHSLRAGPLPDLRVAIGNRRIDGKPVADRSVEAVYYRNVPQKARVFSWDAPDAPADGLDPAMRTERTVIVSVRDKDWPRDGLDVGYQREVNAIGREMGGYTREVLFPKSRPKK